jgi:hypothetical protein
MSARAGGGLSLHRRKVFAHKRKARPSTPGLIKKGSPKTMDSVSNAVEKNDAEALSKKTPAPARNVTFEGVSYREPDPVADGGVREPVATDGAEIGVSGMPALTPGCWPRCRSPTTTRCFWLSPYRPQARPAVGPSGSARFASCAPPAPPSAA